ncbi:fungal-specific transcription factor domain-containing protein [Delphinella strobiligena]|nr:fungal-specific transcription factor domain-containing protein [Delphinella strobiligena]
MRAPASTTKNAKSAAAASSKLHKRSRTGCFTCRLRRKKCDEGKPHCRACKHLGLKCEYKRPMWWSDGDSRRRNKETIKSAIRNTQVAKKNTQSPPGLCHSGPSSETNYDSVSHSRAPSVSTPFSPECMFTHQVSPEDYFAIPPLDASMAHQQYPMFSPFEVDIKTERQIFVNDIPTRRDSTISTFSTFQPPALSSGTPGYPADGWVQQEYFETQQETFAEEPVDFEFFQLPHGQMTPNHETIIVVDECDRPLLNHFIDKVSKLIFPILDANQHGSARSDIILPALESNKCYLHCCLSIAAIHMRSIDLRGAEQLDADTLRHRHATISELCEALHRDTDHAQILEATLGMIFFQCSVGRPQDCLPDIPWHQHFQAATELVQRLQLPNYLVSLASSGAPNHPPFNMTLTAWIDILGSTMLGRSPKFADTYRELIINNSGAGLAELMGCDDRIMFLISEIACLEARKLEGLLEEVMLCQYIEILGNEITKSEVPPESIKSAISATGAVRPKQLTINITCIFRIAARIYLCSMIPGYNIGQVIITNLINDFVNMMEYIPAGVEGFDRSLIWPLLVAGSASLPNSSFRPMFDQRCQRLGEAAEFGSFGRMREIFKDVWKINEAGFVAGDYQSVHWRNVMHQKEWDSLLI